MSKKYIEKERALQLLAENASDDEVFFAARAIEAEPAADVKPVAEIINAVEDAILVLNAINSRGNESFDYADYWELHDAISSICSNCGADMRKEEDDGES